MTAPDQPKEPPTQRVRRISHALLDRLLQLVAEGALAEEDYNDAQTALAAKDARIAELEKALNYSSDYWENEAQKARACADRLEAQLQAARAAGTREDGLRVIEDVLFDVVDMARDMANEAQFELSGRQVVENGMVAIRARLTPAEPTADTGEKG